VSEKGESQADAIRKAAVWGFLGVVLAALIALGKPFAEEWAKRVFASPTPTATPTPTVGSPPPTATPTPAMAGHYFRVGCVNSETWIPHHGEAHPEKSGCWPLEDWGLFAQDGGLLLSVGPTSSYQWHGIYAPLPPDSDIQFKIRIDELKTASLHDANIALGVVNTDSLIAGRFLFYHVTSSDSPVCVTFAEWGLENRDSIQTYAKETDQQVRFSIHDSILNIFLDGEQVAGPVDLHSMGDSPKAFWIGYSLSVGARLSALISDFSITQR